jgi:hypothetical protein
VAKSVSKAILLPLALTLILSVGGIALAQEVNLAADDPAVLAVQVTHMGYRCSEGGGGAITAAWTTGNLGNTWDEGEWVPYQVVITGIQSVYPNFTGLPNIEMSFDFTSKGSRCVDLIRDIQVGTVQLTDPQGFPSNTGTALPVGTRTQIETAQNYLGEWAWQLGGGGNFVLLNLPETQIMRDASFGVGTPTDDRKYIRITPSDLTNAGIPTTADVVVLYYQLHESRTFMWENSLQSAYDQTPTDEWGGYLYSLAGYATDMRNGSGFVSGSSLHTAVAFAGEKTVPIPVPPEPAGVICGLKWNDGNADGVIDPAEPMLSGWRIYVTGEVEGISVGFDLLTDADGSYCFENLTSSAQWYICEDVEREVPYETGYQQTYPYDGVTHGLGVANPCDAPYGDWGWYVAITRDQPFQDGMDFGNRSCTPPLCTVEPHAPVCVGDNISLQATSSGTPTPTYCWQYSADGNTYGSCLAATEDYSFGPVDTGDEGYYRLTVTNDCGVHYCSTYVRVDVPPTCSVSHDPACVGDNVTLDATVVGDPDLTTTYCWQYSANGVTYGSCVYTSEDYPLGVVDAGDQGYYRLTVTNACGSSDCTVYLRVDVPPTCSVSHDPACDGDNVTLDATVTVDPDLTTTYCWQYSANGVTYGSCVYTSEDYPLGVVDAGDQGYYRLTVTNACGSSDCTVYLRVDNPPTCSVSHSPACVGDNVTLDATVVGDPDLTTTYCWQYSADDVTYGSCIHTTEDYPLGVVDAGDQGYYRLTVTNACGSSDCTVFLRVDNPPTCSITHDAVCAESEISLHPDVTEDTDLPTTYCWQFREDGGDYGGCIVETKDYEVTGSATMANEGWYRLTVSNDCGSHACSVFVDVYDITCSLECPADVPDCNSQGTIGPATVDAERAVTYQWSVTGTGWAAAGPTDEDVFTYTTGECGSQGVITLIVSYEDDPDCNDECQVTCGCQCRGFCSYTQGAYGSHCPDKSHPPTQPGCIRDDYFDFVYGSDGIWLGDPDGDDADNFYAAHWPDAAAVEAYLPSGGPGKALTGDVTYTSALPKHGNNTLIGQVLALTISVDYSCNDVFTSLGLLPGGVACYGDFIIPPGCGRGVFDGWNVGAFLATADSVIGGLIPMTPGADTSSVKGTAGCLNELYDECRPPMPDASNPGTGDEPLVTPEDNIDRQVPTMFEVSGAFPNPAKPSATIHYAVPVDGRVTVEIFDIQGRRVTTLLDEWVPAGYHSIAWNGRSASGQAVATGVYFCRVQCCEGLEITEKMIKIE